MDWHSHRPRGSVVQAIVLNIMLVVTVPCRYHASKTDDDTHLGGTAEGRQAGHEDSCMFSFRTGTGCGCRG